MPLRIHLREAEPPREGQVLSKLSEDDSPGPSGHRVCNGVNILSNDGKFGVVEPPDPPAVSAHGNRHGRRYDEGTFINT